MSSIGDVDLQDWEKQEHIKLTDFKENPDGSADCQLHLSAFGAQVLMNFAFVNLLKRGLEEGIFYTPPQEKQE